LEIGDGYARLARRQRGMHLLQQLKAHSRFRILPIDEHLMQLGIGLFSDRPDKDWGLTDCVSFALMEREGIREALTADPHFRQAGFVPLLLEPETTS
jgi:predicted nucleic acid-binding protein